MNRKERVRADQVYLLEERKIDGEWFWPLQFFTADEPPQMIVIDLPDRELRELVGFFTPSATDASRPSGNRAVASEAHDA